MVQFVETPTVVVVVIVVRVEPLNVVLVEPQTAAQMVVMIVVRKEIVVVRETVVMTEAILTDVNLNVEHQAVIITVVNNAKMLTVQHQK